MPLPKALARFNKVVTNRITRRIAGWAPGFAIVVHQGRRSGRTYRTPVNVFRRGDRYVFAATYGLDAAWVKNVVAAGGCAIETRGRRVEVHDPQIVHDPEHSQVPAPVAVILRALRVDDFVVLSR